MTDSLMKDRVTALAGVFQAAVLVDELANGKPVPARAFATSINSLFALDADRVADIYAGHAGDAGGLAPGRDFLGAVLRRDPGDRSSSTHRVSHVMAMLHLNSILRGNPHLQTTIRTRLAQIAAGTPAAADRSSDDVVAKIAALYVDTFGTLGFRVQVKGEPRQLQIPEVAAKIRASLLAGVRSAHLWHHLGGRRWHLLFGARTMLDALN